MKDYWLAHAVEVILSASRYCEFHPKYYLVRLYIIQNTYLDQLYEIDPSLRDHRPCFYKCKSTVKGIYVVLRAV